MSKCRAGSENLCAAVPVAVTRNLAKVWPSHSWLGRRNARGCGPRSGHGSMPHRELEAALRVLTVRRRPTPLRTVAPGQVGGPGQWVHPFSRGVSLLPIEHSVVRVCLSMLSITNNKNLCGKGPAHVWLSPSSLRAAGVALSSDSSGVLLPSPEGALLSPPGLLGLAWTPPRPGPAGSLAGRWPRPAEHCPACLSQPSFAPCVPPRAPSVPWLQPCSLITTIALAMGTRHQSPVWLPALGP